MATKRWTQLGLQVAGLLIVAVMTYGAWVLVGLLAKLVWLAILVGWQLV